jgi:glycosyl transferase family 25
MSHNLSRVFYINLDKRDDRRTQIVGELQRFNLYDKSERFAAIHTPPQGNVGCAMSHLEVLKLAKARNYEQVLILEDDFYFVIEPEAFEHELAQFFQANIPYTVLMISYNIQRSEPTSYPFIQKIIEAQTASGYIVHNSFYDTLIGLYAEGIPPLRATNQHWLYANDAIWKRVQPTSNWYAFTTRCGKQRDGYSDNSNTFTSYNV